MSVLCATDVHYKVYSDLAAVEAISAQWDGLLRVSPCNRAFGSAEWYLASCRTEKYESFVPYTVVASRGAEIVAILPLVINSKDAVATIPNYCSDYSDIVASSANPALVADLLSHAFVAHDRCRVIVLSMLREDSNCVRAIPFISAANIDCRYRETDAYHCIRLPRSFEDYPASKSRNFRKSLKRVQRGIENSDLALQELGPDDFDPARLPELCLSMISARQGDEFVQRAERIRPFISEVFPRLFARGSVRVFVMRNAGRIVALDICMTGAKSIGTWNGGFLAEAEARSPGTLLIAFGIRQAIDMELDEYDFLKGDESYKRRWANDTHIVGQLELVART